MKSKLYPLIILFTIPFLFSAKKEACTGYYEYSACRPYNSRDFEVHGLSKSARLEIGVTESFDIDLYGGKDFIVSCCTGRNYYPIHMRLLDEENELLYDNMVDDYIESVGFSLDTNKTITVELTILAEKVSPQNFDKNRSCAGVLIMWRRTPDLGF